MAQNNSSSVTSTQPQLSATDFNHNYWQSFKGIADLYGLENLAHFSQATVVVIGLGGVGSWCVETLARTGIGNLILVDADDICVTNINRQLPAMFSTIGEDKGEVLAERVKDINPLANVHYIPEFVTSEDLPDFLTNISNYLGDDNQIIENSDYLSYYQQAKHKAFYVIDAIDDTQVKVTLVKTCQDRRIPIVVCGSAGGKVDPSQIYLDDLSRTKQDPMLSKLRYTLRKEHGYKERFKDRKFNIPAVYSTEVMKKPSGQNCDLKGLSCANGYGSAQVVTCTMANFMSAKMLEIITKEGKKALQALAKA